MLYLITSANDSINSTFVNICSFKITVIIFGWKTSFKAKLKLKDEYKIGDNLWKIPLLISYFSKF